MAQSHKVRITRQKFYDKEGFANSNLYRKGNGKGWSYWTVLDNL